MTSGTINFVYDAKNGMVLNVGALLDSLLKKDPATPIENNPYNQAADNTTTVNTDISDISVNTTTGDVVIHTTDGNTLAPVRSTPGNMVAVEGSTPASEQYVADTKTGTVYSAKPETNGSSGGQSKPVQPASSTTPAKYTVTFAPHEFQQNGLDIYNETAPRDNYNKITIGGQDYLIPWKSVETNKMDRVLANVSGGPADSIHFITGSNNMVMTAPGTTPPSKQILVTGVNKTDELKAWYAEYEKKDTVMVQNRVLAGQVNVAAYDKVVQTVCLVQVNRTDTPDNVDDIQQQLNSIYASSIVTWNVQETKTLNVDYDLNGNGKLDCKEKGDTMGYNDEMKVIIAALEDMPDYNSNVLYICFVDKFTNPNQEGYMPFNRNVGFVYKGTQSPIRIMHDIGHELGHGAFHLRHTFSPKNEFIQDRSTTHNLMDYVDGNELYHYQWEDLRAFHTGDNWFEDAGESQNANSSIDKVLTAANQLIAEYGNVYAIIHCFKIGEDQQPISSKIKQSTFTYNEIPIDIEGYVTTNAQGIKVFTSVLFYKIGYNNVQLSSVQTNFDLRDALRTKLNVDLSDKLPYLAIVVPDDMAKSVDCSSFSGGLEEQAKKSISENNLVPYYLKLIEAINNCRASIITLFVNGYRLDSEDTDTDNGITLYDRYSYWNGIDVSFIKALKPNYIYYADGHMGIRTSNHVTIAKFAESMYSSYSAGYPINEALKLIPTWWAKPITGLLPDCYHQNSCVILDTGPNVPGFNERKSQAALAAFNLMNELKKIPLRFDLNGKIIDTIDIVCHSMGFAYALGIIDGLRDKIAFGRFYIIAPENAGSGSVNINEWEDIWQYGSDEQKHKDEKWKLDGIAPQTPIGNIGNKRAFIPDDVTQDFYFSHTISNYKWIFSLPKHDKNDNGYVTPR